MTLSDRVFVPHSVDPVQRVSGGISICGSNGSICGSRESVEKVLEFIQSDDRLRGLRRLESRVSPEDEAIHHGHSSSSPLLAGLLLWACLLYRLLKRLESM